MKVPLRIIINNCCIIKCFVTHLLTKSIPIKLSAGFVNFTFLTGVSKDTILRRSVRSIGVAPEGRRKRLAIGIANQAHKRTGYAAKSNVFMVNLSDGVASAAQVNLFMSQSTMILSISAKTVSGNTGETVVRVCVYSCIFFSSN